MARLSWNCPWKCPVVKDERGDLITHFEDKHREAMVKAVSRGAERAKRKRQAAKRKKTQQTTKAT